MYKVLIADDEYWIREELKNLINWDEIGLRIIGEAANGEEALRLISELKPNIVITDIKMPYMDGVKLLEEIMRSRNNIHTIVLSGYSDFNFVKNAMLYGAADYLLKPVTKIELLNVLIRTIEKINEDMNLQMEQINIKSKLTQALMVLVDNELSQLLGSTMSESNNILFKLKAMGLNLQFSSYVLAVISVSYFNRVLSDLFGNDLSILVYGVRNIVNELLKESNTIVFHNMKKMDEIIILVNSEMLCKRTDVFGNIITGVKIFLKTEIHIGVSDIFGNLSHMKKAYNNAISALEARNFDTKSSVTAFCINLNSSNKRILEPDIYRLLDCYINACNDLEALKVFSSAAFKNIEAGQATVGTVRDITKRLISIISDKMNELGIDINECYFDELEAIYCYVDAGDRKGLEDGIAFLLKEISNQISRERSSNSMKEHVAEIKRYISDNYMSKLTLTTISNLFYIEKTYLSRCFRLETGETLTDFIVKVRMNKAIELINSENVKLADIAGMVGYDDYTYFNKVFKKFTGKSPKEY